MASALRFLTDTVFPMTDGRLVGMQRQLQLKVRIDGLQFLIHALPLNLPVAIPDAGARFAYTCDARASAIRSFGMIELLAVQIAKREMREVKIFHVPSCGLRRITADRLAE